MRNRLDGAAEAQAASEKQLAVLRSAIAAERAARPESVNVLSLSFLRRRFQPLQSFLFSLVIF